MSDTLLSYLGSLMSLTTCWLMGSKYYKAGFIVSMASDPLWCYLGITSGLYGMSLLAVTTFFLNVRGLYKLKDPGPIKDIKDTDPSWEDPEPFI
jgi:hypothetical protein